MLPVIWNALRIYAPWVTFPFALVVGVIGYNIEGLLSDKTTPANKLSIEDERGERQLSELSEKQHPENVDRLKDKTFVPKNIFDRNKPNAT